ncbi:hypothetical protein [Pseudomonas sp. NPDC087817]|uniref:hypothetical protein n=1 Tax=Pseudomonas sp. NPDC087817 TaxID=3364451 RepID=UPI003813034A
MKMTETERGGIVLTREITTYCWHVLGEVARATRRPELLPVLQRAGMKETVDAQDIAVHLLLEDSRHAAAARLLEIACGLGLLESVSSPGGSRSSRKAYGLTDLGHEALQRKEVFVPEYGSWRLWASNDPLLDCPILLIEPNNEPQAKQEARSDSPPTIEKIPSWLQKALGKTITPHGNKVALRIDHLEKNLQPQDTQATLRSTWNVDTARLDLKGKLGDNLFDAPCMPPEMTAHQVWQGLLESSGLLDDWDDETRALKKSFAASSPAERNSLRADLQLFAPQLQRFGRFDDVRVSQVALMPASLEDARHWAQWRLVERINSYASSPKFAAWAEDAYAPFHKFDLSMPMRKDLAEHTWQQRETSRAITWHLVAAEDWGL